MYDKENDIQRIFLEDSRDKKRAGIGVYKRASRRGYIRGGIKTQSDFLSNKERKKLNGEVRVYNMYEEFKDLKNCNLDEILKRSDSEIKTILSVIKNNNTCKDICDSFKISNGKLYNFYSKYKVSYAHKNTVDNVLVEDISNNIISQEKFELMNTELKGKYLNDIANNFKITTSKLSKVWTISRSKLNYYKNRYNTKFKDSNENTEKLELQQSTNNSDNKTKEELEKLTDRILELENENKKLINDIVGLAKENSNQEFNGFKIDINGEYYKDELSNRLLSLDNITIEGNKYIIKLHLEEIDTI